MRHVQQLHKKLTLFSPRGGLHFKDYLNYFKSCTRTELCPKSRFSELEAIGFWRIDIMSIAKRLI